jgi:hypothetical protein
VSVLLSVIGEPGVGKTTAVTHLWRALGIRASEAMAGPVPHVLRYGPGDALIGVEVGRDRADFGGTDALSFSILPRACDWIAAERAALVVAEGDRLAQARFYAAARAAGRRVLVVRLVAGPGVAAARRGARGSAQAPSWVAGRQRRVERLAVAQGAVDLCADADAPYLGAALAGMVTSLTFEQRRTTCQPESASAPTKPAT